MLNDQSLGNRYRRGHATWFLQGVEAAVDLDDMSVHPRDPHGKSIGKTGAAKDMCRVGKAVGDEKSLPTVEMVAAFDRRRRLKVGRLPGA